MSRSAAAFVIAVVVATGCAAPTPPPTNCWLALRATYHLVDLPNDEGVTQAPNTAAIMQDRLSAMGLAEFRVAVDPAGLITVELPQMDTDNQDEVRALLSARGELSLVPVPAALAVEPGDAAPAGVAPLAIRSDIVRAEATTSPADQLALDLTLTDAAGDRMRAYTTDHFDDQLAIVLDGVVISAPRVRQPLSTEIQVSGGFEDAPLERLATIIANGPYPGRVVEDGFAAASPPPGC